MKDLNKKAVVYVRVGSVDKASFQNSIDKQLESCQKYADNNSLEIVKVFVDVGVSGKSMRTRSSLQELLEFTAKNKSVDTVLVYKIDRWFRNMEEGLAAEAYLALHHATLVSATEDAPCAPVKKFANNLLLAMAEMESDMRIGRVKRAMQKAFESGDWLWKVPFGYTRLKNKKISINPESSRAVRLIFRMAKHGKNLAEIARVANNIFFENCFSITSHFVRQVILNPFYKGYMKCSFKNDLVKGNHRPIVNWELWKTANEQFGRKKLETNL